MGSIQAERPLIVVLAELADSILVDDLFARRGFDVVVAPSIVALRSHFDRDGRTPAVAIIDFAHPDAHTALGELEVLEPHPALVGIVPLDAFVLEQDALDAAFHPPVDRARLFVRTVELVAERRNGHRRRKLTGIVGAVDGNDLFLAMVNELSRALPAVNAGPILETVLRGLGVGPFIVKKSDVAAMLASKRLAEALARFSAGPALVLALQRIGQLAASSPASEGLQRPSGALPLARIGRRQPRRG